MGDGLYAAVFAAVTLLLAGTVFLWLRQLARLNREGNLLNKPSQGSKLGWRTLASTLLLAVGSRGYLLLLAKLVYPEMSAEAISLRWDAPHYMWIAQNGYTADTSLGDGWLYIVFYPLYPYLVRLLGGKFISSLAVSWASLGLCCLYLRKLGEEDGGKEGGLWAVLFLLCFPTAFFLGMPYTESLFLLASCGCLWSLRRQQWGLAGLWGLVGALTRNLGVLLAVPYLVAWLCAHGLVGTGWKAAWKGDAPRWKVRVRTALPGFLILAGMGIYLLINQAVYGNPLQFLEIQKQHWHQGLGTVPNTLRYTLGNTRQGDDWAAYLWIPQLVWMLATLTVLPFAVRKLRPAEGAYTVVYAIMAMSPTWLLSYPRYLLGMATLYPLLLKALPNRTVRFIWCVVMGGWMLFQTIAFAGGRPIL